MAKKLHYFNLNGLGEAIRYILHYGGHKFEDVRYELSSWPDKRVKESLPFGQLPLYEEGDRKLNQSLAIAKYVGVQSGLVPSDPWEQAALDAIVYNIYDFWGKFLPYIKEQDVTIKARIKHELVTEVIDFFFSRFEKTLKEHNGYFSGKLSWADFILVGIVEATNLFLGIEVEKQYPTIKALVQKVTSFPRIKEYIASRKDYKI